MNQKNIQTLKTLSTVMVVIAIAFAFLIAGIRIFGFEVFGVLTGSMEPTYPTGSLIYVKDVDPSKLRVNDVITFSVSPNVIATHRIVEIVLDEQYPTLVRYRTKGDANKDVDAALVSASNIIGKAMFAIPQMGYLASYIQQPPGIYMAILVCGLMIAFVFYTDSLETKFKEAAKKQSAMQFMGMPQMPVQEEKKSFDLLAVINQASEKVLGRPLIGAKEEEDDPLKQGYTPARQTPSYPQQMQQPYYPQQMPQQPMQGQPMQYPPQMQYPSQEYYPQGQYYPQQMQHPYYPQQMPQQPLQSRQMQYPPQECYQQPQPQQPYYPPVQYPPQPMRGQQNAPHHQA